MPVLSLRGVGVGPAPSPLLHRIDADFAPGCLTAIVGRRGAGRSVLATVLTGQRPPCRGEVRRVGPPAPPVGVAAGFGGAGSVARDLALRAAAWGVDGRDYLAAVAAATGRPETLDRRFGELDGEGRTLLLFAAAYLLPASAYVADGPLLPAAPELAARLEPLYRAARGRAALVWLTRSPTHLRAFAPDRFLRLADGRLSPLPDLAAAAAHLGTGGAPGGLTAS